MSEKMVLLGVGIFVFGAGLLVLVLARFGGARRD
jgi:hypothetical protein